MDNIVVRAIRYLHSTSVESQTNIRLMLEEALRNKYGPGKEIGPLLNITPIQEYSAPVVSGGSSNLIDNKDDTKSGTSDNELELDLLKEDLMCIICNGMGVGARNRLVECGDCHSLYHQECHSPTITEDEIDTTWICASCKEVHIGIPTKKVSSSATIPKSSSPSTVSGQSKLIPDIDVNTSTQSSSKSSSSSVKSSSSSSRQLTPNINIISADKRLQIMKKKAAKMQEKRKLSRS